MTHTANVFGQEFQYIDFEPNARVAAQVSEKLGWLVSESPSDSSARAFLRKTRAGFQGSLKITSAVGQFMADAVGDDPSEVLEKISQTVGIQLRSWKQSRQIDQELP